MISLNLTIIYGFWLLVEVFMKSTQMIAAIIICPWYSNVACRKIHHVWMTFLARNIHLHWIFQMFPLMFRTKKNTCSMFPCRHLHGFSVMRLMPGHVVLLQRHLFIKSHLKPDGNAQVPCNRNLPSGHD